MFSASCVRLEEYFESGLKIDILLYFSRPLSTHLSGEKKGTALKIVSIERIRRARTYIPTVNIMHLSIILATAIACFLSAIHSIFFPSLLPAEPQNEQGHSPNSQEFTRFKCEEEPWSTKANMKLI